MDPRIVRNLLQRLQSLERRSVRFRSGEVVTTSPNLQVSVGGSDTAYTSCRALAHQSLKTGDTVAVLTFGNDLLVLGRIVSAIRNQQIVTGIIGATGSEDGGDTDQFSVSHTASTGVYVITFSPAFSATPVVTATATSWGAQTTAASPSAATISVFNTSTGAVLDRGFHFTAVGPR